MYVSSSPLPRYKLPEDENKVIYLYIRLVLSPLLLSLCPLFFNHLMIYNFIHHLHADASSPDLSSHLPMWRAHMGISRSLTYSMFEENSSQYYPSQLKPPLGFLSQQMPPTPNQPSNSASQNLSLPCNLPPVNVCVKPITRSHWLDFSKVFKSHSFHLRCHPLESQATFYLTFTIFCLVS